MKKYLFFLLLLMMPLAGYAECTYKYDRKLYPHWRATEKSSLHGLKNARELAIFNSMIDDEIDIVEGRIYEGRFQDMLSGKIHNLQDVKVEADHRVDLKWIHDHGGNCATPEQRKQIANDTDNIVITTRKINRSKGANFFNFIPPFIANCKDHFLSIRNFVRKYDWIKISKKETSDFNFYFSYCGKVEDGIKINGFKKWYEKWFA